MNHGDLVAIGLTLKLAAVVTVMLLLIGVPLALWLASGRSWPRRIVSTLVAMPLILPPTVIGFYLLVALGRDSWLGGLTQSMGLGLLPFTFEGLVVASIIYSLPFVVQPLQNAIESLGPTPNETALLLGASRIDRFITVTLPLIRPGLLTATVLGFAHTIGEFGIVLMIGGNIPGETQLVSLALYQHVQTPDYDKAHQLAAVLMVFSFVSLFLVYTINDRASLAIWRRT